ncbi:Transcription initiation factor IIF subunit alpha [Cardamine amara subsp. amara]|uniref:Transcription initiation factor IIF subunit alpha n=1 Tax=Cardamine amara subsp. amara TaxID=228776 RepID=A0ABD1AXP7_CARAN
MDPVTEAELRSVLMEKKKQFTTRDLVFIFRERLKTTENKTAFADMLMKIAKIQKKEGSKNFVVLRDNESVLSSELGRLSIS